MYTRTRLNKLHALLLINLNEMIDHALVIQSLKVMKAYVQQIETDITRLEKSIQWLTTSTEQLEAAYTDYLKDQQEHDADQDTADAENENVSIASDQHSTEDELFIIKWIGSDVPRRTPIDIIQDLYDHYQIETRKLKNVTMFHNALVQRLRVTQSLYKTLKSNGFPDVDDAILESVYLACDTESERTKQALDDMRQQNPEYTAVLVRQRFRYTRNRRMFGDDSWFVS